MNLLEFSDDGSHKLNNLISGLSSEFKLERIGGPRMIYQIGDQKGAVYSFGQGTHGLGVSWGDQGVTSIYVWSELNVMKSPDYVMDIPFSVNFDSILPTVIKWIRSPTSGNIEVVTREPALQEGVSTKIRQYINLIENSIIDEAKRTTAVDFMAMAKQKYGSKAAKLSMPEMIAVAQENDVQIPTEIRMGREYKVDSHHWNLFGGDVDAAEKEIGQALGSQVEKPDDTLDPLQQRLVQLAKVQGMTKMAAQGKVYLMCKKANGKFFRMPGIEEMTAQLERMMSRSIDLYGGPDEKSMQAQYSDLDSLIDVVTTEGNAAKALLVTGPPATGKTYNVMNKIKSLGLSEGKDYIVKKGRITALSMYRTLIEQIDGMVIFDDCDSVVEDKNGVNMLKGALDTDDVREISYDVRGTLNSAAMSPDQRDELVNAISRILRGKPTKDDFEIGRRYLKKKSSKKDEDDFDDDFEDDFDLNDDDADVNQSELHDLQVFFTKHLPNKIDFRGRIIFISNMLAADWDTAILSRCLTINLEFTPKQMFDFIEDIKDKMPAPNITSEQKSEVIQYLRELWELGKIRRDINLRLVKIAFDYRSVDNWKNLINML